MTLFSGNKRLLEMMRCMVPPLAVDRHKGQAGRIAIMGGCEEYTGAPYFAAISALKVGGDISHVFCMKDAALVIKSYSPELIVHPTLDKPNAVEEFTEWLDRMHSVVVGPGLGRSLTFLDVFRRLLMRIREKQLPLVMDADGLYYLTLQPDIISLIKNYKQAVLTPNAHEFALLYKSVTGNTLRLGLDDLQGRKAATKCLAEKLGGVTILQKGQTDIISDGDNMLLCDHQGSPRRCGGQGDLLSGSMATFIYWTHLAMQNSISNDEFKKYGPTMCAAYMSCFLTRECNRVAFSEKARSTTTTDMIDKIPKVMNLFCQGEDCVIE